MLPAIPIVRVPPAANSKPIAPIKVLLPAGLVKISFWIFEGEK
jgi:hypothetical protein